MLLWFNIYFYSNRVKLLNYLLAIWFSFVKCLSILLSAFLLALFSVFICNDSYSSYFILNDIIMPGGGHGNPNDIKQLSNTYILSTVSP